MICREISESRVNLQKQKSGTYADLLELLLEVRPPPLSKPLKQKLFGFGARVGIERGSFTVPSLTHSVFAAIAIVIPDLSISRLLKQQKMEPAVRIELTTHGLQNRCSTAELSWRLHIQHLLPCPVSCQAWWSQTIFIIQARMAVTTSFSCRIELEYGFWERRRLAGLVA